MIQKEIIKNRHVIARLAAPHNSLLHGEFNSTKYSNESVDNQTSLLKNQYSWLREKNVFTAIEFISSAFLHGDISKAQDAFVFLKNELSLRSDIPILLQQLLIDENLTLFPEVSDNQEGVNKLRKLLIKYPWNSIRWVELAWHHLLLGNHYKAEKALLVAHYISPNTRYVIRALSRFYIHTNNFEKALYYATKNDIIKHDPWVLSNQIAISNMCKKTSRHTKNGIILLENTSIHPAALSELASELGTMDYIAGNTKKGRKKFQQSCIKPHENAMAQISWVNRNIGHAGNHEFMYTHTDNDYEAQIYTLMTEKPDWKKIFEITQKWVAYQPFSKPPIYFGSTIAASLLDDYSSAMNLLSAGFAINSNDNIIINNMIYTYTLMGEKKKANNMLPLINNKKLTDYEKVCLLATKGLIEYRFGNVQKGKTLYIEAELLSKKVNKDLYYTALAHHAREEKRIGNNIDYFISILKKGTETSKDSFLCAYIKKNNLLNEKSTAV